MLRDSRVSIYLKTSFFFTFKTTSYKWVVMKLFVCNCVPSSYSLAKVPKALFDKLISYATSFIFLSPSLGSKIGIKRGERRERERERERRRNHVSQYATKNQNQIFSFRPDVTQIWSNKNGRKRDNLFCFVSKSNLRSQRTVARSLFCKWTARCSTWSSSRRTCPALDNESD